MTPPRCEKATILLCDDIREEADGRQSLIGVQGPSLKVARLPYTHRGLSVFVQIVNPADAFPGVQFELIAPDGSVVAKGAGETPGLPFPPGPRPYTPTTGFISSPSAWPWPARTSPEYGSTAQLTLASRPSSW